MGRVRSVKAVHGPASSWRQKNSLWSPMSGSNRSLDADITSGFVRDHSEKFEVQKLLG